MANSMKQELMDEVTTPSGVKSRISKRPSDPVAQPVSAPQFPPSSAPGAVPVSALNHKVPAPFVSRPGGTLVSASAVKSAIMPARVSVPVPPRPALKPQPKATAMPSVPEPLQAPRPKASPSKALEASAAAPVNSHEAATKPPPAKQEPPPSERTQIYRPNLTDPNLRRSNSPASPFDADPADFSFPRQPKLPAEVPAPAASREHTSPSVFDNPDPEDCTVSLTSDALDRMIDDEKKASHPLSSAADEVTRAAEIPIETLAALQRNASNLGIGHDDVTRVYEAPAHEQHSDVTSPGQRQSRQLGTVQVLTEPRVIIKQEEPKQRHVGRWVFLGLCVAAIAAGWVYRAPIGKQMRVLQASISRGMGAPSGQKNNQAAAVAKVNVSISVSPADAKLTLDGNLITNPYTAQQHPDKQQHKLVAEATGFATLERSLTFERDLTVMLALAPLPQQPRLESPAAAAPVTVAPTPKPTVAAAPAIVARPARAPVAHAAPKAAKPAPERSANCDPPYTVDESGIKAFKPECM